MRPRLKYDGSRYRVRVLGRRVVDGVAGTGVGASLQTGARPAARVQRGLAASSCGREAEKIGVLWAADAGDGAITFPRPEARTYRWVSTSMDSRKSGPDGLVSPLLR